MSRFLNINNSHEVAEFQTELDLKCPVCDKLFRGNIHMCPKGHNICHNCVSKINSNHCPVCRVVLDPEARNRGLERVVAIIPERCKYESFGCSAIRKNGIEAHEANCDHRIVDCPLGLDRCSTPESPLTFGNLMSHIEMTHRTFMAKAHVGEGYSRFDAPAKSFEDPSVLIFPGALYGFNDNYFSSVAVKWGHWMYFWVYAITTRRKAESYDCILKFENKNNFLGRWSRDPVIPIDDSLFDVLNRGINCVTMPVGMAKERFWSEEEKRIAVYVIIKKTGQGTGIRPRKKAKT